MDKLFRVSITTSCFDFDYCGSLFKQTDEISSVTNSVFTYKADLSLSRFSVCILSAFSYEVLVFLEETPALLDVS